MLHIAILSASVRKGRNSHRVALFLKDLSRKRTWQPLKSLTLTITNSHSSKNG